MNRRLAAVLLLAAALVLTGCGNAPDEEAQGVRESTQRLSDGRTVTCLVYKGGYAGGLSCDWDNAR